jgi:hypothetical protein
MIDRAMRLRQSTLPLTMAAGAPSRTRERSDLV